MKCPDTWQITKATGMKNDAYYPAISKQLKMPPFMRGSGQFHFRICTYWQNWFQDVLGEILCYLLSRRRLKRGNIRKRKICVTFTEGRTRNSAGSLRILRCRPSSILHRPHSLPLDSFSVWSHRSWTWCLLHILMPESHRMPCPMLLGVKTEIQMSFKKLKVRI